MEPRATRCFPDTDFTTVAPGRDQGAIIRNRHGLNDVAMAVQGKERLLIRALRDAHHGVAGAGDDAIVDHGEALDLAWKTERIPFELRALALPAMHRFVAPNR